MGADRPGPAPAAAGGGAYGLVEALDVTDAERTGYWPPIGGGPTGGDATLRGVADPLGGGGGGVATLRWYGPTGGGLWRLVWPGNGAVMGATLGVDLRGGGLVTIGTSFQLPTSLWILGGGPVFLGGGGTGVAIWLNVVGGA